MKDVLELLAEQDGPDECAELLLQVARTHADHLGVMLRREQRLRPYSASTTLAAAADAAQHEARGGPALAAVTAEADQVTVLDTAADARWPELLPRMRSLGISSMLCVPMRYARQVVGVMNAYYETAEDFDESTARHIVALARQAGLVFGAKLLEAELRAGIQTRQAIGQAVGILMERHRLKSDEAFAILVHVSQRAHIKVRDLADLVSETGEDPRAILLARHGTALGRAMAG